MSIERKDRILEVHPVTVLHDFVETNKFREREREREIEREREKKQILIILKTFAENDYVRSKVILTLNSFPNTQISNLPTVEKTRIVPRYNVALKL